MKLTSFLTTVTIGSAILANSASAQQLSGAGATFPAPLYQRWAVEYNKLHPNVQVNYQAIGSGAAGPHVPFARAKWRRTGARRAD